MTIHRVHSTSLPELNRVLELIQKQLSTGTTSTTTQSGTPSGGGGGLSTSTPGPAGPTGPAGPAGSVDVTTLVTELISYEDVVMDGNDVVSDEDGYAITVTQYDWDVVTDESGAILTAE